MQKNKFNYIFKIRPIKDVALNLGVIYKNMGYTKIDKNNISSIFNITTNDINSEQYINNLISRVKDVNYIQNFRLENLVNQLNQKWEEYQSIYFNIISEVFDIKFNNEIIDNKYCYLQLLPINELDLEDNNIYLDANKTLDEIFKNFIIMLTKSVLITRWNYVLNWKFNTEFDISNKILMFVEIAIDAIFANSELSNICSNPSYKFFYELKWENENLMQYFRNLYTQVSLDKFFENVYMFVYNNYNKLLRFKKYLY